nr:transposase [Burkholderia territorii]
MDALKRVEAGLAVPDLCRELGISTATFYKWRSKYGGMKAGCTWPSLSTCLAGRWWAGRCSRI